MKISTTYVHVHVWGHALLHALLKMYARNLHSTKLYFCKLVGHNYMYMYTYMNCIWQTFVSHKRICTCTCNIVYLVVLYKCTLHCTLCIQSTCIPHTWIHVCTLMGASFTNRQGSWSTSRVSLALSSNRTRSRNFFRMNWHKASL